MKLDSLVIPGSASVREALRRIDAGGTQLALVVDEAFRLIGTVSDGDIRRALLRGHTLDSQVIECANRDPKSVPAGTSDAEILKQLKRSHLHQMPIVDSSGRVVDLKTLDELIEPQERPNTVVLMVGGLGKRLGDLTRSTPKPMLPVGGRPLLETIIANFCDQGLKRFKLAINFMGEVIEDHFGDGSNFNCNIEYLREPKRLGTAGALSLLQETMEHPIIVSNGDLLLRFDVGGLLENHTSTGAEATMAVREFDYQVPYGVVYTRGHEIVGLDEKPVQRFLISGGLYVLAPTALRHIPQDTFYDMPTLFKDVLRSGGHASAYRIDGYWLDIGRFADYEQAQREFAKVFSPQ